MNRVIALALLPVLALLPACDIGHGHSRVNGSVSVNTGEKGGNVSTVNGAVRVADNASIASASTVNGQIDIGANGTASSLNTVNGGVSIGDGAKVSGNVSTVNGGVSLGESAQIAGAVSTVNGRVALEKGADIAGAVSNVNGRIQLAAAHIGGGIRTVSGDIEIGADSRVENGILVKKPSSTGVSFGKPKVPRIVIGPGAVVEGALRFEREVRLYVSDRATVGAVEGAQAVPFSGDRPPD